MAKRRTTKKRRTNKTTNTNKPKAAAAIFDWTGGERRTETIDGQEITYRVPEGQAVLDLHLMAAKRLDGGGSASQVYLDFVLEHLVAWPWEDVEINEKAISAMAKGSPELFWGIAEAIEAAGAAAKN